MSAIVAVGSMAFDSIETPHGQVGKILGGSVNYFSLAASFFAPVNCVSVVGNDFPTDHLEMLKKRGIDTEGILIHEGKTFHWAGRYGEDLNEAQTLDTELNVFEKFEPDLPEKYRSSEFVYLGNIGPGLQMKVLEQVSKPRFIALDTMNYWIASQKEELIDAISKCHCLIINEAEVRQLTGKYNVVNAAKVVRQWGPQTLVIKRGEYGSILFSGDQAFGLPALPLPLVKDPTGAGDSFAGGFMGYLASQKDASLSPAVLRKAIVYGSIMASFTVQDFGFHDLLKGKQEQIKERYQDFINLTHFNNGT